jgi:hypothetical protein
MRHREWHLLIRTLLRRKGPHVHGPRPRLFRARALTVLVLVSVASTWAGSTGSQAAFGDEPPTFMLSMYAGLGFYGAGASLGSVVSDPPGISCPPTCSASFDQYTFVTLSALPVTGAEFLGWGGCGGGCFITEDTSASAAFGWTCAAICIVGPTDSTNLTSSGTGSITTFLGSISMNGRASVSGSGNVTAFGGEIGMFPNPASGPNWSPQPVPLYEPVTDPFASLPVPSLPGPCQNVTVRDADVTIDPGLYCSITSSGGGTLTLNPGVYVITKGITLSHRPGLGKFSSLLGSDATIYLACSGYPAPCAWAGQKGASINLSGGAVMDLGGLEGGPYQPLVVFFDRNNTSSMTLTGGSKFDFSGAVYGPSAGLSLSGTSGLGFFIASLVVGKVAKSDGSTIYLAMPEPCPCRL